MPPEKKGPARRPVKPGTKGAVPKGKKRPPGKKGKKKEPEAPPEPKKKIPVGEYLLPILVFGITIAIFLNFAGIIEIPYLEFLRSEQPETVPRQERPPVTERRPTTEAPPTDRVAGEEVPVENEQDARSFFPGPSLERVEGFEENDLSGEEVRFQETIPEEVEDIPETNDQEAEPWPVPTPADDPVEVAIEPREEVAVQEVEPEEPEDKSEVFFRMSRIYTSMEPNEAASILENIDQKEVVEILSMMRERDVARILSAMDVELATELSRAMIERR